MRNRFISLAAVLIAATAMWAYNFKSGDLRYNTTSDTTVAVTYSWHESYDNYKGLTSVTIPDSVTYNNKTFCVTSIGSGAFYGCGTLTSITIPESVTSIGEKAFYECSSLTSITIPQGVTSIRNYTFCDCYHLAYVTIPESVESIRDYAFFGCSALTSITIPEGVTSVGEGAFGDCAGLSSLTIPDGVPSIGENAFQRIANVIYHGTATGFPWGARSVNGYVDGYLIYEDSTKTKVLACSHNATGDITIPSSVTSVGEGVFYRCTGITSVVFPEGITSIGGQVFYWCSSLTSITIPESVTSIGKSAFESCASLAYVTIPENVTSIGEAAFCWCSGLTSITIPESVMSIGDDAFGVVANVVYHGTATGSPWGARSVNGFVDGYLIYEDSTKTKVLACNPAATGEIAIPNSVITIESGAFYRCPLTSIIIPNSVTSIEDSAFMGCASLASITIGNNVASIGEGAFFSCGLTSITIPNSVTNIGEMAFYGCTNLTSVIIGDGVKIIQNGTFSGCSNLASVTIGKNVTSIEYMAFNECDSITKVNYTGDIAGWLGIKWNGVTLIYYSHNLYINDVLLTDLVIPDGTTSISSAFAYDTCITSVTIPNSVTTIGYEAFSGCTGLTSVTIPDNVTIIGGEAFYNCKGLTSVTFPNDVTIIGGQAFYGCTGLTSITIPNKVANIGSWAFGNCTGLTSVEWNAKSCRCYDYSPFGTYPPVTSFTFGNEVDSIPAHLCRGMDNLTSITIPSSVVGIGEQAFYDCTGLTKVNYTGDIKGWLSIDMDLLNYSNPFYYSRNLYINDTLLTELIIPEGIISISSAFAWDSCITSVSIPNSVTSIGDLAFIRCTGLSSITIPRNVTYIGRRAFFGCTGFSSVAIPANVTSIGEGAFMSCDSLSSITCYAQEPPIVNTRLFYSARYDSVTLYIPCNSMEAYQADAQWGKFKDIQCIASEPITTEGMTATPDVTFVTFDWQADANAAQYALVVRTDTADFCSLSFNADGQLNSIAYAPAYGGNRHNTPAAEPTTNGFRFVVTDLTEGTHYLYTMEVKDAEDIVLHTYTGEFTTHTLSAVDNVETANGMTTSRKVFRNGQVLIEHGGKIYTLTGVEVK